MCCQSLVCGTGLWPPKIWLVPTEILRLDFKTLKDMCANVVLRGEGSAISLLHNLAKDSTLIIVVRTLVWTPFILLLMSLQNH